MGNIFDETETVTPGNDSRNGYFPAVKATYRVAIESVKHMDGSGPTGNKAFIVELKVLESAVPEIEVGSFRDFYCDLSGTRFKGALLKARQEILTFLTAAAGFDPDLPSGRDAFKAAHPNVNVLSAAACDGKLNGRELVLTTSMKPTKKGDTFTIHAWGPVEGKAPPAQAPAPPPAPPAPDPRAGWQRSPDGLYLLDPAKNDWVLA